MPLAQSMTWKFDRPIFTEIWQGLSWGAIYQSSMNYIFLVARAAQTIACVLFSGVDQAFFAKGSLRVNRAPKSGLFSAHSWPP
jgi:hypothetical protein